MWDDFKAVYLLKSLILIPNPQNICRDLQGIQAKYMQTFIITNAAKTVEDLTTMEFPPDRLVNTISWANKEPFFWVNWLQFVANILFFVWGLHKINIDTQTKVVWIQPNISFFNQF